MRSDQTRHTICCRDRYMGQSGQPVWLISSLITITHFHLPCIAAVSSYYWVRRNRCTIKAVTSQTSWRQRLVRAHSIAVCFFNLVCGWVLFFFWLDAPTSDKVTRFSLRWGILISYCGAIFYLIFAQHVLPTHLVSCSYTYTHSSGLRHTFEVQILLTVFLSFWHISLQFIC